MAYSSNPAGSSFALSGASFPTKLRRYTCGALAFLGTGIAHSQTDYRNTDSGRPVRIGDAVPTARRSLELGLEMAELIGCHSGAIGCSSNRKSNTAFCRARKFRCARRFISTSVLRVRALVLVASA